MIKSQPNLHIYIIIYMLINKYQYIILLSLVLVVCRCRMTYVPNNPGTYWIECLWQAGYLDQTFAHAQYKYQIDELITSVDLKVVKNITGTNAFLILRIPTLKYPNSPDLEAIMYASKLKNLDIKLLWVTLFVKNISCEYYVQFIKELQRNLKINVGIADWKQNWDEHFGCKNACRQFKNTYLLWYEQTQNFSPFGGWSYYDLKLVNTNETKCNYEVYEVKTSISKIMQLNELR